MEGLCSVVQLTWECTFPPFVEDLIVSPLELSFARFSVRTDSALLFLIISATRARVLGQACGEQCHPQLLGTSSPGYSPLCPGWSVDGVGIVWPNHIWLRVKTVYVHGLTNDYASDQLHIQRICRFIQFTY